MCLTAFHLWDCFLYIFKNSCFPFLIDPRVFKRKLKNFCVVEGLLRGSIKCSTLGFSSGHDLTVRGFEPCIELRDGSAGPAWDSVSLPPLLHSHCLSKQTNKQTKLKKISGVV